MNNNTTEIFELLFALAALAIGAPLAGAGIYATFTTIFL